MSVISLCNADNVYCLDEVEVKLLSKPGTTLSDVSGIHEYPRQTCPGPRAAPDPGRLPLPPQRFGEAYRRGVVGIFRGPIFVGPPHYKLIQPYLAKCSCK